MKQLVLAFFLAFTVTCVFAQRNQWDALDDASQALPESKRTLLGLYLTSSEAYTRWKADPDNVIVIDVRTPEEYVFVGHPEMAWNIPTRFNVHESNGKCGRVTMKANSAFVSQVQQIAKVGDSVLLICRSGSRSAAAANLLAKAGFKHVFNITDGFEGETIDDQASVFCGKRMKNGWKNAGLPWTYDVPPGKMRL